MGDVDGATMACQQSLAIDPDYYYATSNLAKAYALQGKYEEAVEVTREATDTVVKDVRQGKYEDGVWLTLGTLQLYLGHADSSRSLLRAVEIDKDDERNRLMLARLYLTSTEHLDIKKALYQIRVADESRDRNDPRFKRILAQAYLRNQLYDDTIRNALAAIKGGDEPAYGHLLRAVAYAQKRQLQLANAELSEALDTWPERFAAGLDLTISL